ncbi:MAG: hypothetical protein M3Y78_09895, partial [Pseudomonadota bacterium]|nr:hypothetical protein [Pseudomonadota bacterium]
MIVYGDRCRIEEAGTVSLSVRHSLARAGTMPPGVDRHAVLVRAFIRASELLQGVADAEFERRGFDAGSALQDSGAALLSGLAVEIDRSWRSRFASHLQLCSLPRYTEELSQAGRIKTKTAEGYAHYALYPESYLEAARRSGLGPETCVIGIRSIGTGLAALVAAALGAGPAVTVRPKGHPFRREIRASDDLLGSAVANTAVQFAVVDEGPGLSGSSFASVARWLAKRGVDLERIHFFPSHDGEPGDAATPATRNVWRRCPRHPACPEEVVVQAPTVQSWVQNILGPLRRPLEEFPQMSSPQDVRFGRRKFLARNGAGSWLVKFAGLGDIGERKLHDAQALAAAGFGPETAGLCYGFLMQRYIKATHLDTSNDQRSRFIERLGSYLSFRAQRLAAHEGGASLDELRCMTVENTLRSLGADASDKIARRLGDLPALESCVRQVRTDNRLQAWEWLVTGDGFLKIDAVDHCEGHDLIGCQDIAWDVAGGIAEHDLTAAEAASLCHVIEASGTKVNVPLL